MRILFVHSGADLYGASRSLLRLIDRLQSDGHEAAVVLPYEGPLLDRLRAQYVRTLVHPLLPSVTRQAVRSPRGLAQLGINIPRSTYRLGGLIGEFRPDVVHTNTALILTPGLAARLAGIPHVWHVREFFSEFPSFWKKYQWYMNTFSDRIVCVSNAVGEQFHPKIRRRKVAVIHDGFPHSEFSAADPQRVREFRERFNVDGHFVVGVVGRIKFKRKGQEIVVRAAQILRERYPHLRYAFVGSPFPGNESHLENLRDLIRECGVEDRVVLCGEMHDMPTAFASLDVSVLPSALPEPFGGIVIESMAMGKPVIGTNIGGTIEQIDDGATGFLIEPDRPDLLAESIARFAESPALCQEFGRRAREKYLREFEFDAFYRKMTSLYSSVIKSSVTRRREDAVTQPLS
jgi:glycosyltransferase involved in cell wall biosynthesis